MAKRSCFCCLDEFDVLDLMCCDNNDEHSLCIPCFSAQLSGQCNGNVNQFLRCSGLNCSFRYSTLHLFEIEDREVWSKVWRYSIQVTLNRWEAMLVGCVSGLSDCRATIALHNAIIEAMIFRCPKCKTPFMTSVEGACAALTCCNLYFCGLCMEKSNTSRANHIHLRRCGSKDDYYYTAAEYEVEQIPAKKKRVLRVLNGLSEKEKKNIMNHSTTKALMSALGTINLSLKEAGLEGFISDNLLSQLDSDSFESCIRFVAKSLESFAQQPFGILLILVVELIKSALLASLYRCVNHPCCRKPMVFLSKLRPPLSKGTMTVGFISVVVAAKMNTCGEIVDTTEFYSFLFLISILLVKFVYGKVIQAYSYVLDKTNQFAQRLQSLRQSRSWGRTIKAHLMEHSQSISHKSLVCWTTGFVAAVVAAEFKLTGDTLVLPVLRMLFKVLIPVLLTIFVYGKIVQASSYVLDKADQFAQWRLQSLRQSRSWGRTMKAQLMEHSQSISHKSLVHWKTGFVAAVVIVELKLGVVLPLVYNHYPLLIMMIYFLPSLHAAYHFISELNH